MAPPSTSGECSSREPKWNATDCRCIVSHTFQSPRRSLGVILYELLQGYLPFHGGTYVRAASGIHPHKPGPSST